jgi:hypothetical protein
LTENPPALLLTQLCFLGITLQGRRTQPNATTAEERTRKPDEARSRIEESGTRLAGSRAENHNEQCTDATQTERKDWNQQTKGEKSTFHFGFLMSMTPLCSSPLQLLKKAPGQISFPLDFKHKITVMHTGSVDEANLQVDTPPGSPAIKPRLRAIARE